MMPPMPKAMSEGMPSALFKLLSDASRWYAASGLVANISWRFILLTRGSLWYRALYTLPPPSQADVCPLHRRREGHRKIQISLENTDVERLREERDADQYQERQSQSLDGRMAADEDTDCRRDRHHRYHRDEDD